MPPLASNLVETATWEPFGNVAEDRHEVDSKEARGKKDIELVRGLIGNAN
jgi:hypothetical protein